MKKKIVIVLIAISFAAIGVGCSSNDNKIQPSIQTTSQESNNTKPLGSLATPSTGKIEVNIGTYPGIVGNELTVIPELSGDGNSIGSYGLIYYDSTILKNETLVKFYNDVVLKSKCNYIVLVNTQDPKQGISISSSGTLNKGTVSKVDNNSEIINSTQLAIIDSNSKTFTWQNA